jgi:hypothetical protein
MTQVERMNTPARPVRRGFLSRLWRNNSDYFGNPASCETKKKSVFIRLIGVIRVLVFIFFNELP